MLVAPLETRRVPAVERQGELRLARREPVGGRDDEDATRTEHPRAFVHAGPPVRNVLEQLDDDADVHRPVGPGQGGGRTETEVDGEPSLARSVPREPQQVRADIEAVDAMAELSPYRTRRPGIASEVRYAQGAIRGRCEAKYHIAKGDEALAGRGGCACGGVIGDELLTARAIAGVRRSC